MRRLAVFLWSTPLCTALSSALAAREKAESISSLLPVWSTSRKRRISVRKRERIVRLCMVRRCVCLILFSAERVLANNCTSKRAF